MRRILCVALVLSTASIVVRGDEATSKRWWAHVQALANDGMEGRMTGSLAHKRAADYVVAQFQRAGLEPAGTLGLPKWNNDSFFRRFALAVGSSY